MRVETLNGEKLKGGIFQRGGMWWIRYRQFGRLIREKTGSTNRHDAKKLLTKRNHDIEAGRRVDAQRNRWKVGKLLDLLITYYTVEKMKDLDHVERRVKLHLRPFFGHRLAVSVTSNVVRDYVAMRQGQRASVATINREMANLMKAFALGIEAEKIDHKPPYKKLDERGSIRTGFFSRAQLEAVVKHLRPELAN